MLNKTIKFFLENKLVTVILLVLVVAWGIVTAPFNWNTGFLPNDPVPVDAIPDIGENQQIVFTDWMGRSPQDVEDQITYPLTTSLLGMPGVKSIRSTSMFGFSSIYIIFEDDVEFYWSRSRILEKLNSLPSGLLPEGVQPKLGPDATGLGQVYFYTLEGRDENGNPVGGWDLHELRSIQDYYVRYGLAGTEGVAEVATIGGHVKEYQVDLDPVAMKAHNVSMMQVMNAIKQSNLDIGANTMEINQVEFIVRGLGYVKSLEDIEKAVVKTSNNVPLRIRDIAKVNIGPASRAERAILDKGGAEAVGGVVVARYGDNPLQVIDALKAKIDEITPGLPSKTLEDGTVSKVTIVPFYDRSGLIKETLNTLNEAISLQILITIIVIMVMVYNLRASILISALLPLAVLMCFIMMKYVGVDANIVALSGIAIAIGTMVDLGIILNENILRHLEESDDKKSKLQIIYDATTEVSSAILTAVMTTIVSFLPVFTLQAAEGKLFGPLAYTKTFALIAALIFTLVFMPAFAHWVFGAKVKSKNYKTVLNIAMAVLGFVLLFYFPWAGWVLLAFAANHLIHHFFPKQTKDGRYKNQIAMLIAVVAVSVLLAIEWRPLGLTQSVFVNFLFIGLVVGLVLGVFALFIRYYAQLLNWCLENAKIFLLIPLTVILLALNIWIGFGNIFGFVATGFDKLGVNIRTTSVWSGLTHTFPGMGKEFMPALNEGSFLLMPTSMPHSGVEANMQIVKQLDMLVQAIPEVEMVVGKAGRAESPLDPAPMSMYENIINYKTEYLQDDDARKLRFEVDREGNYQLEVNGKTWWYDRQDGAIWDDEKNYMEESQRRSVIRNVAKYLVPNERRGQYFRQWRDEIRTPDDIWDEIQVRTSNLPGVTSAPKLQPIETRLVMLQTGMRAPMGMKVYGPDLETIEDFSLKLESVLKEVPSVKAEAVFADRSLGKPYLEIDLDRTQLGRFGLNIADVQEFIEVAIGGMTLSTTVEGRERYAIRARYAREYRDDPEALKRILVSTPTGAQIPLGQLAEINYRPGPMMIRGENTFLVGYVLFDKRNGFAEGSVVDDARNFIQQKIDSGELKVPTGVSYTFSGSYENQIRAEKRLAIVIPLCLAVIFLILYLQFRSTAMVLMIFSAIAMAFSGGFMMLWLYGQDWFFDFSFLGTNMRELFQMRTFNLSVAVWVGFIALFGIATDDGVVMGTYLKQSFEKIQPENAKEVRKAVLEAGLKRVRPCLMTTATTLLALLPVLTSSGRGSDIMIPMAIPAFGGMTVALISLFIVPVLYGKYVEIRLKYAKVK
ncbi:Cobalt-zinc-cadmium resistance protein CzcA [Indibacter alkaliphilus LW1]|uniref:Cobalt-zinc-cadmium resistance protein CzcA n=1 Tax=Indibacter alkaliphilus (strain CCUG 57479 / KCTC 22604 / LW1) TaxID=1189612 RepID=S2E129_INDAL|nr:efflux RND transporter permease subunit [Indibacter alkaliphilus]EOZ95793.1 Cobalt-zinc-cadmium resistance protein CzcA [Indibacter alkaliphilus LW1]